MAFLEDPRKVIGAESIPISDLSTIGRDPVCSIRVDREWVSRQHAVISSGSDGFSVTDTSSTGLTWVNGARVRRSDGGVTKYSLPLANGDTLGLGDPSQPGCWIEFRFWDDRSLLWSLERGISHQIDELERSVEDPTPARRLRRLMSRMVRDLRGLCEVGRTVNSDLEVGSVVDRVLVEVLKITEADKALVLLVDVRTGQLRFWSGRDQNDTLGEADEVSRSVADTAFRTGKLTVRTLNRGATLDAVDAAESMVQHNLLFVAAIPLVVRSGPLGVLYVDSKRNLGEMGEADETFLLALADLCAVALDNARAYGRLREEKEEIEARVREIRVEIDRIEEQRLLAEVAGTELFQQLQARVRKIREKI